jgi:hypothetical protein
MKSYVTLRNCEVRPFASSEIKILGIFSYGLDDQIEAKFRGTLLEIGVPRGSTALEPHATKRFFI